MHLANGTIRTHAPRRETVSPVGLATLVAALHLALLTGRLPVWSAARRQGTLMIWRTPADSRADAGVDSEKAASRPIHCFAAGQLALAVGMSLVAMARWLHIMRLTGTHGH